MAAEFAIKTSSPSSANGDSHQPAGDDEEASKEETESTESEDKDDSMDRASYFVVDNLHCPSCIFTVKSTLYDELAVPAANVHISLVSHTITVRHDHSLTAHGIGHALEKVGFDVELQDEDDSPVIGRAAATHQSPGWFTNPLTSRKRRRLHREICKSCQAEHEKSKQEKRSIVSRTSISKSLRSLTSSATTAPSSIAKPAVETDARPTVPTQVATELVVSGMTCASCANAIHEGLKAHRTDGVLSSDIDVLGHSAKVIHDTSRISPDQVAKLIDDLGYEAQVVSSRPMSRRRPNDYPTEYRLEFHLGGMTCASCSNAVTNGLKDEPYIKSVNVNLMANSGTVILSNKDDAIKVKEAVESMGYTCDLGEIAPLRPPSENHENDVRVVRIRVDGMFCEECPNDVIERLQNIPGIIDFTPISIDDPIVVVRYKPSPPDVTLRTIFDGLRTDRFTPSLEKRMSLEERSRRLQIREQRHILWRIIASVILAIPTFIIGIVYMALVPHTNPGAIYWETPIWGNASRDVVALFFLATPVQFFIADHFHRRAIHGLHSLWRKGSRVPVWKRFIRFGSMDLLISLGTSVAYFSSIALLILEATATDEKTAYSTTFFDTTVFLTMFILLGRYLEAYTKHKAADAVTMLAGLRPEEAILDTVNGDERVSTDLLEAGDIVKVPNGSSPPGDGTILSGTSKFDESSLTGESHPVHKSIGDSVYVGTINLGSVVTVKLEAIGGSSMLDKIVTIVRQGQANRAPIERLADTLTGYFVPVVVLLAILTWVIWLSLGLSGALPVSYLDVDEGGWTIWSLQFAIAVFVIACPCGIGLAAPTACYVGAGLAAKFGILVQGGGEAFQEASLVDCVVFDKTGTLTEGGEPKVTDSEFFTEDRNQILAIANALENASTHTLALAMRAYCEQATITDVDIATDEMEETGGKGVYADLKLNDGRVSAIIGNESWMEEHHAIYPSNATRILDEWKSQAKSVVLLATQVHPASHKAPEAPFKVVAQFAVADPIRKEAAVVIAQLRRQGIATWMISGDNPVTASAVAAKIGIAADHVIAGVLPHQKAEKAQWLQRTAGKRVSRHWWSRRGSITSVQAEHSKDGKRAIVAMVGDGINDAPALAVSDLGIAVGSGSDVALGSAKFILLSSNLLTILTLFNLSATVFRRIKFNFFWAIVYNMVGVPIAAGVLYPVGVRLDASWAALLMALSSVSVVLSSLHLKLYKPPKALRNVGNEELVELEPFD